MTHSHPQERLQLTSSCCAAVTLSTATCCHLRDVAVWASMGLNGPNDDERLTLTLTVNIVPTCFCLLLNDKESVRIWYWRVSWVIRSQGDSHASSSSLWPWTCVSASVITADRLLKSFLTNKHTQGEKQLHMLNTKFVGRDYLDLFYCRCFEKFILTPQLLKLHDI